MLPSMKNQMKTMIDTALRLLARRDHSIHELKTKLKQRAKITDDVFENLICHLKKMGYLADETNLAERWAKQWRSEGRGRNWICQKLKTKGLPQISFKDDDDERAAALYFLEKKLRGKKLMTLSYQDRAKLGRALVSRGFSHSLVATLLHP
jgi:regulatory protein